MKKTPSTDGKEAKTRSTGGPVKVTGVTGMERTDEPVLPPEHPWNSEGAQSLLQKEEDDMLERIERKAKQIGKKGESNRAR